MAFDERDRAIEVSRSSLPGDRAVFLQRVLLHFPPILLLLSFMPNQHFLLIHSFLNPCNLVSMFTTEPKLGF